MIAPGEQVQDVASGIVGRVAGPPTDQDDYPVEFRGFSTWVNVIGLRRS